MAGGYGMATSGAGVLVAARTFSRPWPAAKFLFQTFCDIVLPFFFFFVFWFFFFFLKNRIPTTNQSVDEDWPDFQILGKLETCNVPTNPVFELFSNG